MSATKNGSCLCKRVRFTITGNDRGAVVCHCINCQRVSGSAFAHNHQMTNAKVEFVSGEKLIKSYTDSDTKSGHSLQRIFCSECGSSLFLSTTQTAGLVVLMSGCIEGNKQAPKREFFKHNKEGWVGDIIAAKI